MRYVCVDCQKYSDIGWLSVTNRNIRARIVRSKMTILPYFDSTVGDHAAKTVCQIEGVWPDIKSAGLPGQQNTQ